MMEGQLRDRDGEPFIAFYAALRYCNGLGVVTPKSDCSRRSEQVCDIVSGGLIHFVLGGRMLPLG